jgi:hypothetical protein
VAKRLTDCGKWDKVWFRKLSPVNKCFWIYVCDRCDHVGIWEVDFEIASLYIGAQLNQEEIKTVFSKQFIELNHGSRWLIKDFLLFQYGSMKEGNKMFDTIETSLKKHGLNMGDIWGINGGNVNVKEPVKVKVKETVKEKHLDFVLLSKTEHDSLLDELGGQVTREYIERLNNYIGSTGKRYKSHYHTIKNWIRKDGDKNTVNRPILTKQQQSNLLQLEQLNKELANDERSVQSGV